MYVLYIHEFGWISILSRIVSFYLLILWAQLTPLERSSAPIDVTDISPVNESSDDIFADVVGCHEVMEKLKDIKDLVTFATRNGIVGFGYNNVDIFY